MPPDAGRDDLTDVVIVGAGASGSLLAGHLLRGNGLGRIVLVERRGTFGPGVAYSTREATHLLNVPAGGMSAVHDQPNHLVDWLKGAAMPANAESFVPRSTYGVYLRSVLDDAERSSDRSLTRVNGTAVGIRIGPESAEVELEELAPIRARSVVLALGNSPPADLPFMEGVPAWRYVADPWDASGLNRIAPEDPVLLVGSGLTAIDVTLSLSSRGHRGPIHMASRHGLLPQVHRTPADRPASLRNLAALRSPMTAARLVGWLREEIRLAEREGDDWRDVMNALRPWTQRLWTSLSVEEKATFVRHLSRQWTVHRHRMAPEIGGAISRMLDEGQLNVLTGKISVQERGGGIEAVVEPPRGEATRVRASWVVNCTGPDPDPARSKDPLVRSLLEGGTVRRDQLGLGFDCTTAGALVDDSGVAGDVLWTIGPPRLGSLWETTSIPEIREQAATLADHLDRIAAGETPDAALIHPLESV